MSEENQEVQETENENVAIPRDALQDRFDEWHGDELEDDNIIELLHADHGMSYPAAVNKLRVLKKAAGLTKPKGHKAAEVQEFIQACHDEGDDRATTISKMVEKYGYTKHSAASTFSVQGAKIGLAGGGGASTKRPIDEVVTFARAHATDKRADFAAAMVAELGYTESTSASFFTYLGFAQEYARQELAAAGFVEQEEEAA